MWDCPTAHSPAITPAGQDCQAKGVLCLRNFVREFGVSLSTLRHEPSSKRPRSAFTLIYGQLYKGDSASGGGRTQVE